jgi:phosphatidylserine/phosphatidylglycerophosphate/cardiolipin synthase-like enzyme
MADNSRLNVRIIANIQPNRGKSEEATIRAFAADFFNASSPFDQRPRIFYDPGSLQAVGAARAVVHAKLAVVDRRWLCVGSVNLTATAFHRNLEAGLRLKNNWLADEVVRYFDILI